MKKRGKLTSQLTAKETSEKIRRFEWSVPALSLQETLLVFFEKSKDSFFYHLYKSYPQVTDSRKVEVLETWWSHHSFCSNMDTLTISDRNCHGCRWAFRPMSPTLKRSFPVEFFKGNVFHGVVGDCAKRWLCFFFHFFNGEFWHVVVKDGHRTSQQLIFLGLVIWKVWYKVLFIENDAVLMGFYQEDTPQIYCRDEKNEPLVNFQVLSMKLENHCFLLPTKASELLLMDKILHHQGWCLSHYL